MKDEPKGPQSILMNEVFMTGVYAFILGFFIARGFYS